MFRISEYKKVQSLQEAWELNQKKSTRTAGGMTWLRLRRNPAGTFVDLSGLGLDRIEETEEEIRIGCMVTLRALETSEIMERYTEGAAKAAVCHIIGVQFRNLATVGGSIFGRFGFSDVLTLFLSLDTYVEMYRGNEKTELVPLPEFAAAKPDRDILTRVIIRKEKLHAAYESVRTNASTDFPALTAAGTLLEDGSIRLVIGAKPQRAERVPAAESWKAERAFAERSEETPLLSEETIRAYAEEAKKTVKTGSNMRGSSRYRSALVGVETARILRTLAGAKKPADPEKNAGKGASECGETAGAGEKDRTKNSTLQKEEKGVKA
ncbi:CO or xanthine dehydrogenase, FAD-binding subunit [[Clostridium] aminophilum]|uniref:CO or xanthine dehydrogenase, FAD-binding subunit n=1 Tax=[Clostridium] aminophilum TaxID=1526 RepID=A0A1I0GK53_9FIRM|nr:FAD binding domain-containing protein [[Clostridium] aminophilum]SET70432.1 CO or xanthine dehydrogenase, FAD-binding subunit [[Clostridium] aminophilum]